MTLKYGVLYLWCNEGINQKGGRKMHSSKDKKGVDWKAVGISFAVSTLSGLLVAYLCKLFGL